MTIPAEWSFDNGHWTWMLVMEEVGLPSATTFQKQLFFLTFMCKNLFRWSSSITTPWKEAMQHMLHAAIRQFSESIAAKLKSDRKKFCTRFSTKQFCGTVYKNNSIGAAYANLWNPNKHGYDFFFSVRINMRRWRPPIPCQVAKCASSFFIQPSTKTNSSPSIHNLTSFNNGQALVGPPHRSSSVLLTQCFKFCLKSGKSAHVISS